MLGKIVFSTKDGFAFNATGLEQPLWDPALDAFWFRCRAKRKDLLAVIKVDKAAKKFTVEKTYKTPKCNGSGLALGPSEHLLVGCDDGHPLLIMNAATGQVLKTIPEIHGADEVWYNPGDHHFYAASGGASRSSRRSHRCGHKRVPRESSERPRRTFGRGICQDQSRVRSHRSAQSEGDDKRVRDVRTARSQRLRGGLWPGQIVFRLGIHWDRPETLKRIGGRRGLPRHPTRVAKTSSNTHTIT